MIQANELRKEYDGLLAVNDISFEVKPGEMFGFLGPNGAGKTSTIKMLTGQLTPTSGTGKVAGYDIVNERDELNPSIGVVFEVQNLYNRLTARDNLRFFGKLYGVGLDRVNELLRTMNLLDRANDPVGKLSKGMRQRLLIARALLNNPKVLFLDEPTIGLDPFSAREIREMIIELNKNGTTIFLTTHYMEEADKLCDRIVIIDRGKIVAQDTPKNLKRKYGKDASLEDVFIELTKRGKNESEDY